jgi:hypothetical protein
VTESRRSGHGERVRFALLGVTALTAACGARTTLDMISDGPASNDAGAEAGCGFEVTGAVNASVAGLPTVCGCGTEVPFIRFTCAASLDGVTYSLAGDYVPAQLEGITLTVGATSFSSFTQTPCTMTVAIDGVIATQGSSYRDGEPFSITIACPSLASDDAGTVAITAGRIDAVIAPL